MSFWGRIGTALGGFFGFTSGYHEGASSARWARGFNAQRSRRADEEILLDLPTLRDRSADVYRNNALGRGVINTDRTNVIGRGMRLNADIDREFLKKIMGMSDDGIDDYADEWEANTERRWNIFAESNEFDVERNLNFAEACDLSYLTHLRYGDSFGVMLDHKREGSDFNLRVRLINPVLCGNPWGRVNDRFHRDGLRLNANDEVVAYCFRNYDYTYSEIPAHGMNGRKNVLHLIDREFIGQSRGVPMITSVLRKIFKTDEYSEYELDAASVMGAFTAFITSDTGQLPTSPIQSRQDVTQTPANRVADDFALAPGAILGLRPNEKVEFANPTRPNTAYAEFYRAQIREIGMALGIPYEILAKEFQSSYSASRAARAEAQKYFVKKQTWFAKKWCQPIYEEWLYDQILNEKLIAPGFLNNFEVRKAFCGAQWIGEPPGQIQEGQEIDAADKRVASGYSTRKKETAYLTGTDFEQNVKQLARENRKLAKAKLPMQMVEKAPEAAAVIASGASNENNAANP